MSIYLPSLLDKFKDFVNGLKANWQDYETHKADNTIHKPIYVYEQLPDLSNHNEGDILLVYNNIIPTEAEAYEQGTIITSTPNWEFSESTTRIRSKTRILAKSAKYYFSFESSLYDMTFNYYDENDAITSVATTSGWKISPFTWIIPPNHSYFRVVFRRKDGADILPSEITTIKPLMVEVIE